MYCLFSELLRHAPLGGPTRRQMLKPCFRTSAPLFMTSCTSLPSLSCEAEHSGK